MKDKLISANALIEHLDVTIAESKGLIGSTCVAIKCYVEQMPAVDMPKWIPVTERLPEMHTKVLCCGIRGGRFIAELSTWGNGNLYWDKRNGKGCPEVTHWMPLPEPPKGE